MKEKKTEWAEQHNLISQVQDTTKEITIPNTMTRRCSSVRTGNKSSVDKLIISSLVLTILFSGCKPQIKAVNEMNESREEEEESLDITSTGDPPTV